MWSLRPSVHPECFRDCSGLSGLRRVSSRQRTTLLFVSFSSMILASDWAVSAIPFRLMRGGSKEEAIGGETFSTSSGDAMAEIDALDDIVLRLERKDSSAPKRNLFVENFTEWFLGSTDNSTNNEIEKVSLALRDNIRQHAREMKPFLVDVRRTLHRHPELMYQEKFTSAVVQRLLQQMNISFTTGWGRNIHLQQYQGAKGGYGIVADIGTGNAPCVVLRADMDALPIHERTEGIDEFRSLNDRIMHACGHDGHTTMLLGAASILKSMEESIPGTVRIMFQPAEEGGAGGKRMTEEGVLTKHPLPSYAFGMHVWPTLPSGSIAARPGPLMAACERFEILIHGVGGHAAMPHLTVDPIVTASAIVINLQTIVSRNTSPLEAAVCSITQFDAGSGAFNVIPEAATLKGTIRSLSTDTLLKLRDRVQYIVETTAQTYGCNVTIEYSPDYYPVTVNDPWLYESLSKDIGALVSGEGYVRETEPTMGAEDFSFIAESIPSTFFFLGQGSGQNPPTSYGVHHPHFALDENVLPTGVELHVNLAIRALTELTKKAATTVKS
jgi:IAA-amino acid hydrolase